MEGMHIIVEYTIAESTNFSNLGKIVNDLLKEGWQPYGMIVNYNGRVAQPMVKR